MYLILTNVIDAFVSDSIFVAFQHYYFFFGDFSLELSFISVFFCIHSKIQKKNFNRNAHISVAPGD